MLMLNDDFHQACSDGDLEKVRLYLRHGADITHKDYEGFTMACINEHVPIVKYLLTSPELKIKADIHAKKEQALKVSICNKNYGLIKYLLTCEDLFEKANIHQNDDEILKSIYKNNDVDSISFLLTQCDVVLTDKYKQWLDFQVKSVLNNANFIKFIKKYNLNEKLNNNIVQDNGEYKSHKI